VKPAEEVAAAQQVVDLFATEALLALDTYAQSVPSYGPSRQSAEVLARWWRTLRMDDVQLGDGSDSEQILAAAADISLDPDMPRGLDLREAIERANDRADLEGRPRPAQSLWEIRQDFENAYGGQASVTSREEAFAESLTRLARAAVLRDVVAQGAQVRVSEPLQAAADELVRQGQHLMESHQQLASRQAAATRQASAPAGRGAAFRRQVGFLASLAAYGAAVDMSGAPLWAQIALKTPAGALYIRETLKDWPDQQNPDRQITVGSALDPAQAQLRSVRTDLINNLDASTPATRRDTRTLGSTNRPTPHGR
jgi:hypothetical protein